MESNYMIQDDREDTLKMLNKYIYMVDNNAIIRSDTKYFGRASEEHIKMLHYPQYNGDSEIICEVMAIMERNNISW